MSPLATTVGASEVLMSIALILFIAACCLVALISLMYAISWVFDNWEKIEHTIWGDQTEEISDDFTGIDCSCCDGTGDCANVDSGNCCQDECCCESSSYEIDLAEPKCPHKKAGLVAAAVVGVAAAAGVFLALRDQKTGLLRRK